MNVEYETISCSECGVLITLPEQTLRARRKDHKTFYCPNGHSQYFPGKTREEKRIEKLEKEIDALNRKIDGLDGDIDYFDGELRQERKAHASTKGLLTKARNKIAWMEEWEET